MRMKRVGPLEELDAGQSRHPLVGDQQRDRIGPRRECPQPGQSFLDPDRADDARIGCEPPAQVGIERPHDRGVGGDDEDDRQRLGCAVVRPERCFDVMTLWCSDAGADTRAPCTCPQGSRPSSL